MSTLRNLATKYSTLDEEQIHWLELLMLDWALLADLALGDVVLLGAAIGVGSLVAYVVGRWLASVLT